MISAVPSITHAIIEATGQTSVTIVEAKEVAALDVIIPGPQGPQGPPGPGVANYTFQQVTPSRTWTINHNLGFRPSVELLDSGSQEIDGDVVHPSVNQTVVTLNPASAGLARLT